MDINDLELRIVKVIEDMGEGQFLSEDVFSQERIGIKLSGKQRMNLKLPIEAVIYVSVRNSDKENARYIHTWRNPMRLDNTETPLEKQRKKLDDKYIEIHGADKFDYIRVYSEFKKFEH